MMEPRIAIQRRDLYGSSIQTSDPIWFPQELSSSVTDYLRKLNQTQPEDLANSTGQQQKEVNHNKI